MSSAFSVGTHNKPIRSRITMNFGFLLFLIKLLTIVAIEYRLKYDYARFGY